MKYLAPFALIFGFAIAAPTPSLAQHLDIGPGGVSVGVNHDHHDRDHHDRPAVHDEHHDDGDHGPVVRIDHDHPDDHHGDRHDSHHDSHHGEDHHD